MRQLKYLSLVTNVIYLLFLTFWLKTRTVVTKLCAYEIKYSVSWIGTFHSLLPKKLPNSNLHLVAFMGDDVVPELNTEYAHVVLSSFVESEFKKYYNLPYLF